MKSPTRAIVSALLLVTASAQAQDPRYIISIGDHPDVVGIRLKIIDENRSHRVLPLLNWRD